MNNEEDLRNFCRHLVSQQCLTSAMCRTIFDEFRSQCRPGSQPSEIMKAIVRAIVARNGWTHPCADPAIVASYFLTGQFKSQSLVEFAATMAQEQDTRAKPGSVDETREGNSPPRAPTRDLMPSQVGPYKIDRQLGKGGMGVVYHGMHKELGYEAAIKVVSAASMPKPEDYTRFKSEARVVVTVSHPNFVRGYGAEFSSQPPYMALEYVEGQTLDKAMAEKRKVGDLAAILDLVAGTAEGVNAMHARGLVHRDLKPANVIVDANGRPVVLDPGMVREVGKSPDGKPMIVQELGMTEDGSSVGTQAYMPPEQVMGEHKNVGPWSDVYALAKMLYEGLTGERVHDVTKGQLSLLTSIIHPLPPTVESALRRLVAKKHEADWLWDFISPNLSLVQTERHANGAEFAQGLREMATRMRNYEQEAEERRNRLILRSLIGAAILAVVFAGFAVMFGLKQSAERDAREAAEARAQAETTARTEAEGRIAAELRETEALRRVAEGDIRNRELAEAFLACQSLINACDWPAAETSLRAMLARDENYEPARYALAFVLFNQSKAAGCVEQWDWLLAHGLESRRSEYGFYAVFHREQLEEQTDTSVYEPVLAKITDRRYLGLARAMLALSDGAVAASHGDTAGTTRYFNLCQQSLPAMEESDELYWLLEGMRGYLAWKIAFTLPQAEGVLKIAEARGHLEQSVARNPDFPMSIFWLADIYRTMGQFDAAAVLYLRLQILMPNWVVPRSFRMACLLQRDIRNRNDSVILRTTDEMIAESDYILTKMHPNPRQANVVRLNIINAWAERSRIFFRRTQSDEAGPEALAAREQAARDEVPARATFFRIVDQLLIDAADPQLVRPEEKTQLENVRRIVDTRSWRQ